MKSRKYYTPAEFAKLFRIDRQTLIYYDNHGIFSPSFKNENGYRYYGLDQVFRFAELLALRKLAIPGCRLSEFSAAPSRDLLKEILEDKIMEYEEELQRITRSIKDMKSTIHSMEQENILPMEQIMLIPPWHPVLPAEHRLPWPHLPLRSLPPERPIGELLCPEPLLRSPPVFFPPRFSGPGRPRQSPRLPASPPLPGSPYLPESPLLRSLPVPHHAAGKTIPQE